MSQHTDTGNQWLNFSRLYEEHTLYYALIAFFWVMVGMFSLGFEINGFSPAQNLFFNFMWYLSICALMITSLIVFCNTYEVNKYKRYINTLEQEIEAYLSDEDKETIWDVIENDGHTLPTNKQRYAILFLGCYVLFEIFFILAWVKDLALVWEPNWASVLIEWVRDNTDFVSDEGVNHQLFAIRIKPSDAELYQLYTSEREFLASSFGAATALFQVFRTFVGFPLGLLSVAMILWRPMEWLGFSRLDPRHIHSFGSFIFSSIATFVSTFFFIIAIFYNMTLDESAFMLLGIEFWQAKFFFNFSLVFAVLCLKFMVGWFVFWKNVVINRFF